MATLKELTLMTIGFNYHLDSRVTDVMNTTADAPGANDDGSGVAAMMELAKIMSKRSFPYTILFCCCNREEQGCMAPDIYRIWPNKTGILWLCLIMMT
jgi:putative aminopeptidase FrvX